MATSLFDKYGGFARVSRIVGAFYDKVLDSDIVGPFFDDVDMRRLIDHQTKFIASIMGGPASYSRDALQRVHRSLGIDRAVFDETALLLKRTLEEAGVEPADVDQVINEIRSYESVIVSKAAS